MRIVLSKIIYDFWTRRTKFHQKPKKKDDIFVDIDVGLFSLIASQVVGNEDW
jgi:hypothetical protein